MTQLQNKEGINTLSQSQPKEASSEIMLVPLLKAYKLLTGKKTKVRTAVRNLSKHGIPLVKIGGQTFVKKVDLKNFAGVQ